MNIGISVVSVISCRGIYLWKEMHRDASGSANARQGHMGCMCQHVRTVHGFTFHVLGPRT